MAAENNKVGDMTKSALDSIKTMLDANTVVGTPIETKSGTTIIPISKISVGYASGGLDYKGKQQQEKPSANNFGGGGGTGITVTPVGFLTVYENGEVNFINTASGSGNGTSDTISTLIGFIEKSPELIEKLKGTFSSKKGEENDI